MLILSKVGYCQLTDSLPNLLFSEDGLVRSAGWPRQAGPFVGAGNTLSATMAAMLANGLDVPEAVSEAKQSRATRLQKNAHIAEVARWEKGLTGK